MDQGEAVGIRDETDLTSQTGPARLVDWYWWFSLSLPSKRWLTSFINFVNIRNIIVEIYGSLLDCFHEFIQHFFYLIIYGLMENFIQMPSSISALLVAQLFVSTQILWISHLYRIKCLTSEQCSYFFDRCIILLSDSKEVK